MIYIDLPADLNLEDDQGRNIARLADAVTPDAVMPGAVLVAGVTRAWSWAVVESVDSGFVYFRQISAQDVAARTVVVTRTAARRAAPTASGSLRQVQNPPARRSVCRTVPSTTNTTSRTGWSRPAP